MKLFEIEFCEFSFDGLVKAREDCVVMALDEQCCCCFSLWLSCSWRLR